MTSSSHILEQRAAWRRLRESARHNDQPFKPKKTHGMTVEQKITHWSGAPRATGCVPWMGGKGTPVLRFGGVCHPVRALIWERMEGKAMLAGHVASTTCGDSGCVAEGHIAVMARGQAAARPAQRAKKVATERLRYGKDNDRYMSAALGHIKSLRFQLLRKFGYHFDVEDVLQEALLRVYLAWARDRKVIEDVNAFLARVAYSIAIDVVRHNRVIPIQYCDPQDLVLVDCCAPAEADPAVIYERALTEYRSAKRANAHLRKVPERARQALRLRVQHGLSQIEIAARMRISVNTVEGHLRNSRNLAAPRKRTSRRNVL